MNNQEFKEKCKILWNGLFSYDETEFISLSKKIYVNCIKHDNMCYQLAKSHINKINPCKLCDVERKKNVQTLTTQEFIEKSFITHKDEFYSYDKVMYKDSKTEVDIICNKHGIFSITPDNFLNKKMKCPKCTKENNKVKRSMDFDTFKKRSEYLWNNKYKYLEETWIDFSSKTGIICSEHGLFFQYPNNHLRKSGCRKCSQKIINDKIRMNNDEFLEKVNYIHSNKYTYISEYTGYKNNIVINCSIHGNFIQKVYLHINGSGCPKCNKLSNSEKIIFNYLESKNIDFIYQKKFNDCIYKRTLNFDFYIPSKNLIIEYDGIQHFEYRSYFGNEIEFNKTILRDNIKNEYCKNNNINLLRISYKENIIQKLKNFNI